MLIVPIGVDCKVADFCIRYNLRKMSLPFDWCVSYNGVSKCIEDDFKQFINPLNNKINSYDIYFHHDFDNINQLQNDSDKYIRRCNRLVDILHKNEEEIMFLRNGHCCHHHDEHNGKYNKILSDIEDVENLDNVISVKYPKLKYKIVIILSCDKCFDPSTEYKSKKENIEIYNIASTSFNLEKFNNKCFEICKKSNIL
jgi:hypothetical protein